MIDEHADATAPARRPTRAQQRAATRTAILDATGRLLVEDGYTGLTTRRVAELAGIAQSTVMHHFETREALLADTVTQLALGLADEALEEIDLGAMRTPEHREAVLDQAWAKFTSPPALAAAQLWVAAWSEPELAAKLRELEQRLGSIIGSTAAVLFPGQADDPEFPVLLELAVALIRGLVLAIPVSGRDRVDARWESMKPVLLRAAADLLDG